MTKTLKEIKDMLTKLAEEKNKETQDLEETLEPFIKKIEQAKEELVKAENTNDIKAYNAAKDELWAAENAKEMLSSKIDKLKQGALVSAEDQQQLIEKTRELAEEDVLNTIKKLSDLFPRFEELKHEHFEKVEQANTIYTLLGENFGYSPSNSVSYLVDSLIEKYERIVK